MTTYRAGLMSRSTSPLPHLTTAILCRMNTCSATSDLTKLSKEQGDTVRRSDVVIKALREWLAGNDGAKSIFVARDARS